MPNTGGDGRPREPGPDEVNDSAHIVVDGYGIKTRIAPSEGTQRPRSWIEVARRLNDGLKALVVAPFDLTLTAVDAVTRILRGIAAIPGSIANRVAGAHYAVDRNEASRQAELTLGAATTDENNADLANQRRAELIGQLEAILGEARANGRDGAIVRLASGRLVVMFGTDPENRESIAASLEEATRLLPPAPPPD